MIVSIKEVDDDG